MSAPSSSNLSRNLPLSANNNKRSSDNIDSPAERESKKARSDSPVKDKRRRRKKKRKVSVTTGAGILPVDKSRILSRSMSLPLSATAAVSSAPQREDPSMNLPDSALAEDSGSAPGSTLSVSVQDAEIAELKEKLQAQSITLAKHESSLGQIQQSVTCQICLDLLHKPFALAPCGHVACHSCLVAWFTAPSNPADAVEPPNHYSKRKTCPHCRVVIRERPIEIWSIKEMVAGLSQSGLLSTALPPPPETTALPADPWDKIFRPVRGERAMGALNANNDIPVEEIGIRDAEDGNVYRCVDCLHEIWQGQCTGCERPYPAHRFMLDDLEDDEEDDIDHITVGEWFGPRDRFRDALLGIGEDDSSDYEGSFIDDDAEGAGHHMPGIWAQLQRNRRAELDPRDSDSDAPSHTEEPEVIVFSSDDEDEEPPVPRRRRGPVAHIEILDSSDEEGPGDANDPITVSDDDEPPMRATRAPRRIVDSDVENTSEAGGVEEAPLPRRPTHLDWLYDDDHRYMDEYDENSDTASEDLSDGGGSQDLRLEMEFDQGSDGGDYDDDVYSP